MQLVSSLSVPLMIITIIIFGIIRKVNVYDSFLEGVRDGIDTTFSILPALIALITSITMFRASGALSVICRLLAPITNLLAFPAEVLPLAILRPISGSASLAMVKDILSTYGADSFTGRVASVLSGSTETTLYTIAVYFGAVKVKDSRHTLKSGLIADLTGMAMAVITVKLFF